MFKRISLLIFITGLASCSSDVPNVQSLSEALAKNSVVFANDKNGEIEELIISPHMTKVKEGQTLPVTVDIKLKSGLVATVKPDQVKWFSHKPSLAQINNGELVTLNPGIAFFTAEVQGIRQDVVIDILPATPLEGSDLKPAPTFPPVRTGIELTPTEIQTQAEPTPIPTPIDNRPPIERIVKIHFTKSIQPPGLKVTPVFLGENDVSIAWQWDGDVALQYTIRNTPNNWELVTNKSTLTKEKPFFIAEGSLDNLHEELLKSELTITYTLTLPGGKVLSGQLEPIGK